MHSGKQKALIFDIKHYAIHDGPGIRTTIFLKGCPLRCRWCHNPEGISSEPEILYRETRCRLCNTCISICPKHAIYTNGQFRKIKMEKCDLCGLCLESCTTEALELVGKQMTVDEVLNEIEKDQLFYDESGGGVTFSGGEPLFQIDFLEEILTVCSDRRIHTVVDTSGHANFETFERILDKVNLILYDLKAMDDRIHRTYTGVSNQLILQNLKRLLTLNVPLQIRIPLVPGVNDSEEEINSFIQFLTQWSNPPSINILPYHNWGISKKDRLTHSEPEIVDFGNNSKPPEHFAKLFRQSGLQVQIGG